MRQFILTVGTLAAVSLSCWFMFQGISSIIKGELERSLLYLLLYSPILLSLAVSFDFINSHLHVEYRNLRRSLARNKGAQVDVLHPQSKEVKDTPWENDASHTSPYKPRQTKH